MFTTEADQIATVGGCQGGGCKMLINEISNYDFWAGFDDPEHEGAEIKEEAKDACSKVVGNSPEHVFYGGIIGWKSLQQKTPEDQGCEDAVDHIYQFNHDISMFAIPAYTLDIPECMDLLEDPKNFGLEATKEESKEESKYQWKTKADPHEAYNGASYSKPKPCKDDPWASGTMDDTKLAWCHFCPSFFSTANGKSWDDVCCDVTADDASRSLWVRGEHPKPQKDKWCDSCPTQYSLVGNSGGDSACWEEKIKTCHVETAITTIYGNAAKAASQMPWSSGWSSSSGGYWKVVEANKCTERGFNPGELEQCFYEEYLNTGCLYD